MTETGDDGIATAQVLLDLLVPKREQAGLGRLRGGVRQRGQTEERRAAN